jgi:hypothetical protein
MTGRLARILGIAIFLLSGPCAAVSPDDYNFPIGKIDQQIQCQLNQSKQPDISQPEEPACLNQFAGTVSRSGDDLRFRLDQGKTRTVKSNSEACEQIPIGQCVIYRLVGYIASSQQFVLRESFYESEFVQLVSRRTGAITKLEGYPHLSPSGSQFVTVAASDAWEIDNPIAIFSNTDPPKLLWRFPQPREYEEYSFDGWDGEDRVKLHTITDPNIDTDVTHTASGWALRRPNGQLSTGTTPPPTAPP